MILLQSVYPENEAFPTNMQSMFSPVNDDSPDISC